MTYQQTVDYLFNRLPAYQKIGITAYKADLSNTIKLCDILNHPENNFKSIHVAGTNGKGSTCHMLASIFQEAGYKVGLYSSPHLIDFRERVKINGEMISQEEVISFVEAYKLEFEDIDLSFFEWTTALAFHTFSEQNVDIAIIETGLGGRLDSTNVIIPELSIITNISKDHNSILGNTLEEISIEKAGIIKPNIPVVVGEQSINLKKIFQNKAKQENSEITFSEKQFTYTTDLKGIYQVKNINTCVTAIKLLQEEWNITEENIVNGLNNVVKNTNLNGRWQKISTNPKVICDVGHNEAGISEIVNQLKLENYKHLHIVWGMANDKDVSKIIDLLPKSAQYYLCAAKINRALSLDNLIEIFTKKNLTFTSYSSVKEALEMAKNIAQNNDLIFVGGSTFTVAEIF